MPQQIQQAELRTGDLTLNQDIEEILPEHEMTLDINQKKFDSDEDFTENRLNEDTPMKQPARGITLQKIEFSDFPNLDEKSEKKNNLSSQTIVVDKETSPDPRKRSSLID